LAMTDDPAMNNAKALQVADNERLERITRGSTPAVNARQRGRRASRPSHR
jgi:predicted NAD-dependent protein-ADP-ribosyltransferase YbiA (DUF1768 family)